MRARLAKERQEYESDIRDRQLRDLQLQQIRLEERRELLSQQEGDLRKKWRFLEKKKELLQADWDELSHKNHSLQQDRGDFEDWAGKIRETAVRLQEERDKVLGEKAEYDYEREQLEKARMDVEMQRSIVTGEFVRAQELAREIEHRERMLNMLKYNKEVEVSDILLPTFTSAPNNKVDPRQFLLGQ
jgi:putative cell wall-binding protein